MRNFLSLLSSSYVSKQNARKELSRCAYNILSDELKKNLSELLRTKSAPSKNNIITVHIHGDHHHRHFRADTVSENVIQRGEKYVFKTKRKSVPFAVELFILFYRITQRGKIFFIIFISFFLFFFGSYCLVSHK
jgi:hypothetical protein